MYRLYGAIRIQKHRLHEDDNSINLCLVWEKVLTVPNPRISQLPAMHLPSQVPRILRAKHVVAFTIMYPEAQGQTS